jgi:hypothetical protein
MSPDELRAAVRRFVEETVLPHVDAWDRADDLPDDALLLALAKPALT